MYIYRLHAKTILFAGDTTVYFANKSIDTLFEIMSQELNSLSDWFRANKLSLNISKPIIFFYQILINKG